MVLRRIETEDKTHTYSESGSVLLCSVLAPSALAHASAATHFTLVKAFGGMQELPNKRLLFTGHIEVSPGFA